MLLPETTKTPSGSKPEGVFVVSNVDLVGVRRTLGE
jgi:hypothetical protein